MAKEFFKLIKNLFHMSFFRNCLIKPGSRVESILSARLLAWTALQLTGKLLLSTTSCSIRGQIDISILGRGPTTGKSSGKAIALPKFAE